MGNGRTHVIAALVEHKPGVLHNIANLFRRRGFNIESISVGSTVQKDLARMTLTVNGDEQTIEQVVKQLNKLIDVIKVSKLDPTNIVTREMVLVKVNVQDTKTRSDVINCVNVFRGHVIDVSSETLTIEITGGPNKIAAFLSLMKTFGIMELARTGIAALSRGSKIIRLE